MAETIEIRELAKVKLDPEDVLIVRLGYDASVDHLRDVAGQLNQALPKGARSIVVTPNVEFDVKRVEVAGTEVWAGWTEEPEAELANEEAERLVDEGRARWFCVPGAAQSFAEQHEGWRYAGEVKRMSIYRYLAIAGPDAEALDA